MDGTHTKALSAVDESSSDAVSALEIWGEGLLLHTAGVRLVLRGLRNIAKVSIVVHVITVIVDGTLRWYISTTLFGLLMCCDDWVMVNLVHHMVK